jgi:hypothetical protein
MDLHAFQVGEATKLTQWFQDGNKLNVVDGCAGAQSIKRALTAAGVEKCFNFISIDTDAATNPTICMSIEDLVSRLKKGDIPEPLRGLTIHIIWCSPPCTPYSAANSNRSKSQKRRQLKIGDRTVTACLELIEILRPAVYFLENPDSGPDRLSIRPVLDKFRHLIHTVTYCDYGRPDRKASMILTNLRNVQLLDCRRPGEQCLAKIVLGRHTRTAQAGPSTAKDGSIIKGTPRDIAQLVPDALLQHLFTRAVEHFGRNGTEEHLCSLKGREGIVDQLLVCAVRTIATDTTINRGAREYADLVPCPLQF